MTAQALWRERERETLIAACAAALCPDGAVRKNAQREHGGGKTKQNHSLAPSPCPTKKKEKNPNNSAREMGKKIGEQMQTCSCPNCILQSTSQAAGFPPCLPVFPAADGVVWFSFAAGFAW